MPVIKDHAQLGCCLAVAAFAAAGWCRAATEPPQAIGEPWRRHTIDDSSQGPDGVRLADINGDGRLDVVAPWEQGGQVVVYIHPGAEKVRERWPQVVIGKVGDPEDAVFVDLDGDGSLDVVSACEGTTRTMYIHWGPTDPRQLLDPQAWSTAPLGNSAGRVKWMFSHPLRIGGHGPIDVVAGSRGDGAAIGWFESPRDPRAAADWKWHPLYHAGWVMTLKVHDMNGDGRPDIVATDREGPRRGALWLENPGERADARTPWREHQIGAVGEYEAMHCTIADLDRDGLDDVIVAVKGGPLRIHRRLPGESVRWDTHLIEMPANAGTGKAPAVADIDQDGSLDLVVTCEHAIEGRIGVFWYPSAEVPGKARWEARSISGPEGFIFDLLQLVDLDGDGDLDVLTEEEKGPYLEKGYVGRELGVLWYENPTR